jgi:hypothetical protein
MAFVKTPALLINPDPGSGLLERLCRHQPDIFVLISCQLARLLLPADTCCKQYQQQLCISHFADTVHGADEDQRNISFNIELLSVLGRQRVLGC